MQQKTIACATMLVMVSVFVVSVQGQSISEPQVVLQDPQGDTAYRMASDQSIGNPFSATQSDFARIELSEGPDGFLFTAMLYRPDSYPASVVPGVLDLHFRHGDQEYLVNFVDDTPGGAGLYRVDSVTAQTTLVQGLEEIGENTEEFNVFTTHIPRGLLHDENGAAPFPGRELNGFWAYSQGGIYVHPTVSGPFYEWDRMPDEGVSDVVFEVQMGVVQEGTARLWSPSPARASNGAATTFVYPVAAQNTGDSAATFQLNVLRFPDGWSIEAPGASFALDAGELVQFPVLATLPFAHKHGGEEVIQLQLQEVDAPSNAANLDLSVVFHSIPQPAGHHPIVWFHSRAGDGDSLTASVQPDSSVFASMNTWQEDPEDDEVPVRAVNRAINLDNTQYAWTIPLHPSLQMGLDFDLDSKGSLEVPLEADGIPLQDVTLSARLQVVRQGVTTVVADMGPSETFDLVPGQPVTRSFAFAASEEADLIPYTGPASMELVLELDVGRPIGLTSPEAPLLMPGGVMQMPLLEYQDPLGLEFLEDLAQVEILGEPTVRVRPGSIAVFDMRLSSSADVTQKYVIDLHGVNAAWSRVEPSRFSLSPGGSQDFQVTVEAPGDAVDGELAEVVVQARTTEGPSTIALAQVRVVVDNEAGSFDGGIMGSTGPHDEVKESPIGGVLISLVALVGTAVIHRRFF